MCGNPITTPAEKTLGRHEECEPTYNEAAFTALKQWRLDTAREKQHPPYMVFTDATLLSVVEAMPASLAELLDISGIGPSKLEQYGEDVLAVLEDFR